MIIFSTSVQNIKEYEQYQFVHVKSNKKDLKCSVPEFTRRVNEALGINFLFDVRRNAD